MKIGLGLFIQNGIETDERSELSSFSRCFKSQFLVKLILRNTPNGFIITNTTLHLGELTGLSNTKIG